MNLVCDVGATDDKLNTDASFFLLLTLGPSAPLSPLADRRPNPYEDYFFFKALTFAQRALAAALILALAAAPIVNFFLAAGAAFATTALTAGFAASTAFAGLGVATVFTAGFAAFLAAQRAFIAAESLALAAALMPDCLVGLAGLATTTLAAGFAALTLAQRALAAALILAFAAALMPLFLGALAVVGAVVGAVEANT